MRMKKDTYERIKINNQLVAIRVIMIAEHGARYSKQFVVNEHVKEREALEMAKEYAAMMKTKPVSIPSDEEVIKVAEDIVENESRRQAHNQKVRRLVTKDVDFVRRRYGATQVYGYFNTSGDYVK